MQGAEAKPLVSELKGAVMPERTFETLLTKCIEADNSELASAVESVARSRCTTLPDPIYTLLIKGRWHTGARIDEVLSRHHSHFSPDLAFAILEVCSDNADIARADQLFQKMKPRQLDILCAFIRFYIAAECYETACDIFEVDLQRVRGHVPIGPTWLDASLQESLIDAAVVCGRTDLARLILAESRAYALGPYGAMRQYAHELLQSVLGAVVMWHAIINHWVIFIF